MRGRMVFALALAASAGLSLTNVSSAGAHAIIQLNGVPAVAGKTSAMTLEIQHGCITGGGGTVGVTAQLGKNFGVVTPQVVDGWTGSAAKNGSGTSVTWTATGAAQPFDQPLLLPLQVKWPSKSGVYSITATQTCSGPSGETTWSEPVKPATANSPSPPLTPLATVCVLPKRLAKSSSPSAAKAIDKLCAVASLSPNK